MFTKAIIALSATIIAGAVYMAPAAAKAPVSHVHRTATYNMEPAFNPQTRANSDDPALTGGGSAGYNANLNRY